MSILVKLRLYPYNCNKHPKLHLKSFRDGIEFIEYFLYELYSEYSGGLSCDIGCSENENIPSLHFQQVGDLFFIQLFLIEKLSPDRREGWFTLVERDFQLDDTLVPIRTTDNIDAPQYGYFLGRFGGNTLISEKLLVKRQTLGQALSNFNDDYSIWFNSVNQSGKWVNLGML